MIYISALNKSKSVRTEVYNIGKKSFFLALTELNICDKKYYFSLQQTNLYNNHSREEGQAGPQSVSWLVMKTKHAQMEEILIIIFNILISYLRPVLVHTFISKII